MEELPTQIEVRGGKGSFKQLDRETSLKMLMKINLLKINNQIKWRQKMI